MYNKINVQLSGKCIVKHRHANVPGKSDNNHKCHVSGLKEQIHLYGKPCCVFK